jgi:hypothetical protein
MSSSASHYCKLARFFSGGRGGVLHLFSSVPGHRVVLPRPRRRQDARFTAPLFSLLVRFPRCAPARFSLTSPIASSPFGEPAPTADRKHPGKRHPVESANRPLAEAQYSEIPWGFAASAGHCRSRRRPTHIKRGYTDRGPSAARRNGAWREIMSRSLETEPMHYWPPMNADKNARPRSMRANRRSSPSQPPFAFRHAVWAPALRRQLPTAT